MSKSYEQYKKLEADSIEKTTELDGTKVETYLKFTDPDYVGCAPEMFKAAFPRAGVIDAGKLIVVGTAGEMDKLNMLDFDGIFYQELMPYREAFSKYRNRW